MDARSSLIYGIPSNSRPCVSIIIPTHRRPALLSEAIESAISQDPCMPYEVVVMDDDQSRDILDVVSRFPPSGITVYQNAVNLGMWGNVNHALELCRGEWILILCDDDLLMPTALAGLKRVLSSRSADGIGCLAGGVELLLVTEVRPIFRIGHAARQFPLAQAAYSKGEPVRIEGDMKLTDVPKFCSSFFRREYVRELGGWDAGYHGFADLALFLTIQRDGKLFTCSEVFGRFRVHGLNESHPSRIWSAYPIRAGTRLLSEFGDARSVMGRNVRCMIERNYVSALWKGKLEPEMRRAYAEELSRLIRPIGRRFLVKNVWFLGSVNWLYRALRPFLGELATSASRAVRSGR